MAKHFFRGDWIALLVVILVLASAFTLYNFVYGAKGDTTYQKILSTLEHPSKDTISTNEEYVGPPSYMRYNKIPKFTHQVKLDINRVDSATLIKVPGIGPSFAHRILSLRRRLGGYYTTKQLQEVYGIDEDKYLAIKDWFKVLTKPQTYILSKLRADNLPNQIYLNYKQRAVLRKLIYRYGSIKSWAILMKQPEFTHDDSVRLSHYFIADTIKTSQQVKQKQ